MIAIFDTETTGKVDFKSAPQADHQPRLVQFAALLLTPKFDEVAHFNVIVRPFGFEIPKEASDVHGITTENALDCGIPLPVVLSLWKSIAERADIFVAHNIQFDDYVVRGENYRLQMPDVYPRDGYFCTMKNSTEICKIPGPYGYKWPKLQEAHKHAFGTEFDGAHDAMADVRACARLYRWLQEPPCTTNA